MYIITWLLFWFAGMGLPNYFFKKHKITYYENSWQHVAFFVLASVLLIVVYQNSFSLYFSDLLTFFGLAILGLFLAWLILPRLYKNDYYTKKERLQYQLPKFFEIVFQQLCFLGGLLTFGVTPLMFGLIFFVVHIPMFLVAPKKFAMVPIIASLFGGIIIAYLQSAGIWGLIASLSTHILFWVTFHYFLPKKQFFGLEPLKLKKNKKSDRSRFG